MLELQNICYRVSAPDGEQDILKDISITIPDHKLMVFTGPNGGGKTTLAKVVMGPVNTMSLWSGMAMEISLRMSCSPSGADTR